MARLVKIDWRRNHRIVLDGYVGQVLCFYMHLDPVKTKNGPTTLICDLPHVTDQHYGRLVTEHDNPKAAARAAQATLEHWIRRFEADE